MEEVNVIGYSSVRIAQCLNSLFPVVCVFGGHVLTALDSNSILVRMQEVDQPNLFENCQFLLIRYRVVEN